jgi:hypothetical protein
MRARLKGPAIEKQYGIQQATATPRSLSILKYPTSPLPSAPKAETGPL